MRVLLQRVKEASVSVDSKLINEIKQGLLLLVGITDDDTSIDIDYLINKIVKLRVFPDEEGKMNLSLLDKNYSILSISQFTLFASTKKGNRPSYSRSANPDFAKKMYDDFNDKLIEEFDIDVKNGVFGANMSINLINDGPVTILLDSKNKEF